MKKKVKTALATIVTASVILIGSYLSGWGDNKSGLEPEITNSQKATVNSTKNKSSVTQSSKAQDGNNQNNNENNKAKSNNSKESNSTKEKKNNSKAPNMLVTTFPDSIIKSEKEGIAPFGYINATVTKVTDGDTLRVKYEDKEYKVRLLDIDTPESVKAGVEPQSYSDKASELTKDTLEGKEVRLVFEKGIKDQYERLLAHIILKDGTYYNALMVQNGYAICVFYSPNTLLKEYFTEIQESAIEDKKGFWGLPENKRPFREDSKGKLVAAYKLKDKAA